MTTSYYDPIGNGKNKKLRESALYAEGVREFQPGATPQGKAFRKSLRTLKAFDETLTTPFRQRFQRFGT
jgi:hypothetical protein